jgi:signal transduction histidine kinase
MRNRLVAALVGLTVAVIALYGVPRAFFLHDLVESSLQENLERTADFAALAANQTVAHGDPLTRAPFEELQRGGDEGETVVHEALDGTVSVLVGTPVPTESQVSATRTLDDGGTLVVSVPASVLDDEFRAAVVPLLLLGVGLVPVVALLGVVLARRFSRPFTALADAARELGTGRLDLEVPHSAIPEAEAIGQALEQSAQRLDTLIRREREVAAHASHELRTPITAVRLTLEDLALWPQTDPVVAEELHRVVAEVDRLSLAVSGLLEDSRKVRMSGATETDLGAVVTECLDRWEPVARTVGLTLHQVAPAGQLPMHLPLPAVTRAVDLLVQHACEVADEDLTVVWAHRGTHLAVEIVLTTPGGEQSTESSVEAGEVAASLGGRLATEVRETDGGASVVSLVLMLPVPEGPQVA